MVHWNSSPHPISDIRDWSESGRLELRPDFQRREVWSAPARIMLMDTILRDVPMPKIFLANTIRDGKTYRVVIDGQQRITAILDFLNDRFSLKAPYVGKDNDKRFSELDQETQDRFLRYQIDFNEAQKPTDSEVREVYARVNKYTVPLTKQELRRADFPGDFLHVSEQLAVLDFFDKIGIFTPANRRRYADVEYVSELLSAMLDGIQDKKTNLDDFYVNFADWEEGVKFKIQEGFLNILEELDIIFNSIDMDISETRFRQKSDFYTLFTVVNELLSNGHSVAKKNVVPLGEDLQILNDHIRPESQINVCSEYAIKCISQANSASSRRWRHRFLKSVFKGTYVGSPDEYSGYLFYEISEYINVDRTGYCPDPVYECLVCDDEISGDMNHCLMAWPKSSEAKQISNAQWIHRSCTSGDHDWFVLNRVKQKTETDE